MKKLKLSDIVQIIIFNIILGLCVFGIVTTYVETKETKIVNAILGENENPGLIGVDITYDNGLVDQLTLTSPSGIKYTSEDKHVTYTTGNKTITMLIDTDEIGIWTMSYHNNERMTMHCNFIQKSKPTTETVE